MEVSYELIREIEQFLYQEASFLDRPDLDSWVDLYTADGTYWMPAIPDQEDPENHISLFYDDRVLMEVRRRNFVHPAAASKDYAVRASHIISNVQVTDLEKETGNCTVTSQFPVFSVLPGQADTICRHVYARTGTRRRELQDQVEACRHHQLRCGAEHDHCLYLTVTVTHRWCGDGAIVERYRLTIIKALPSIADLFRGR